MNIGNPKEVIYNDIPNNKNLFHFLHRYHILGDIQLSWRPISKNKFFNLISCFSHYFQNGFLAK